jgi:hypothetical protein
MSPDAVGKTLAAILTLAIFSFLYKDNPIYKAAEHLFVGVAAGYYLALESQQVFYPNLLEPLGQGRMLSLVPLLLCLLLFMRLSPKASWLSRWSMGILVGAFSGLQVIGFAQGDLVNQIGANMLDLSTGDWGESLKNILLVVGLLASLFYFFFSVEHRGLAGGVARLGIWFLMISFGASYGFTVMARISLLIGRLSFLFFDWPRAVGL